MRSPPNDISVDNLWISIIIRGSSIGIATKKIQFRAAVEEIVFLLGIKGGDIGGREILCEPFQDQQASQEGWGIYQGDAAIMSNTRTQQATLQTTKRLRVLNQS